MPVVNMTTKFLQSLKPGSAAVEWFDEDTRGLSLKLNPGGAATWYSNYTRRADALRRRVQLGKLTALGLKDARLRATRTGVWSLTVRTPPAIGVPSVRR